MPPDILKDRIYSVKNHIQQTERKTFGQSSHTAPFLRLQKLSDCSLIKSYPDKVHFLLMNEQQEEDSTRSGAISENLL